MKENKRIDEIGKQAVTIHMLIDNVQGSSWDKHFDVPYAKIRMVKKAVNKFLKAMKDSEYYYLSNKNWGESYYQNILNHLDMKNKNADKEYDYLTWLQYQIHSFIKEVFPTYYDGQFKVKQGRFYKKTLEMLLR